MALLTLLITGCSKPEEVISRRLSQANQNLEAGRVEDAIQTLEDLNRAYTDQPSVLEALGFAYARAEQHASAAAYFMRAADVDPRSASLRQLAADSYLIAGDIERAEEQYRLFVAEFPGDYIARAKLGDIAEKNGDYVRALDAFLECYRLHPSGEYAWRVGSAFRRLNNAPQTKSWLETTIKHGEQHVEEALLGLLELELNARDFAAASRTVDQLDRIYPGTLDRSPLVNARADLAAWREQQNALEGARSSQERAAREIEQERRRQEAELQALNTRSPEPPPATPPVTAASETTPEATAQSVPEPAATRPQQASPPTTTPTAMTTTTPDTSGGPTETPPAATPEAPASAGEGELASSSLAPDIAAALTLKDQGNADAAAGTLWNIIANDDTRVDAWLALGNLYRETKNFGDAESCLLEAARRAPERVDVRIALLEIARETQPRDSYFARIEVARRKFPGDADLAYFFARELASINGAQTRAVIAYDDFLLLASPDDPRRDEATAYVKRVRGY